jgi:enoyl-CoA hydratase/carnithine racemase
MGDIHYNVRDHVAHLAIDAPPVNALTVPLLDSLLIALRRAGEDQTVRAVVIESALPRFFCAGLDLTVLADRRPDEIHAVVQRLYTELTDVMHSLGKPVIAAVGGAARGGGMTLAISCNVLLAGESASFGYPEIDSGLVPAIHFTHLPAVIGRHRAFELLFSGRSFKPDEARELGLVSRVVADDALVSEAQALGQVFAAKAPAVMRAARNAFMEANDQSYRAGVAKAVETFTAVAVSPEGREGVRAFAEKRKPSWTTDRDQ